MVRVNWESDVHLLGGLQVPERAGITSDNGAFVQRVDNDPKCRRNGSRSTHVTADAEAQLIVNLYFEGLSLAKIATMLGRDREYVSRVFHSPQARLYVNEQKRTRNELAEQIRDRVAYAAQSALDNIIDLANNAGNEAVKLKANVDLVDRALPQQRAGVAVQVNINADALALAMTALKEADA